MKVETQLQMAENLRKLRRIHGYTQTEVADSIHINRSTYALYESGKKIPGADTIVDLAELYNIRVDTILQPDHGKFVNDIINSDVGKSQLTFLIDTFFRLSPFSQGCLIERAQVLLEQDL